VKFASLARRAVAAVFIVFLHYVPQITLYMEDDERYFGRWGLGNVARIAVGVLLLSGMALAIDWLIRRRAAAWAIRVYHHLFLVALLSGMLAAFPAYASEHPWIVAAIWCIGLAVITGSLLWRKSRLVRFASILCLIFSPLVPILFIEMLLWPRWSEPLDTLPTAGQSVGAGPSVFIFVFDEWSWPRSSRDGRFTAQFPHLQALSNEATVYRNALSPFRETVQSLARFVFQTDHELTIHDGRTWFEADDNISPRPPLARERMGEGRGVREVPTQYCRSLFQAARDAGYRSYLLGFHHAYRHMLGDQVDVCRSYFAGDEAGPLERLADELLENTRSWTDPLSRRYVAPLADRLDVKNWRAMAHRYRDDMFRVLGECPRRSVVVCHVPVPHAPFVFNADGSDHPADAAVDDLEGYRRHLGYVDTLVGQIVETLRRARKYDDALVIITSDHSWRFDPEEAYRQGPDWDRRVPLVIKLPGQKTPRAADEPIRTNELSTLLESVLKSATMRTVPRAQIGL
jgi:hypothetical protein